MNDLQKELFEIFKAFVAVCEKHHLRYYLIGGTCLGAIRHKGFIPWDDDIDVGLPREDYEKFITLQDEFKGTPYFIQTWKSDPKYLYSFAKLRNSNTTYIENFYKYHQFNHGVWVDVFPLDGFSKTVKPAKKFAPKVLSTWAHVYFCYPFSMRRKFSKRTFFKDLLINLFFAWPLWFLNIGHWQNRWVDKKVSKIKFEDAKLVGLFFGTHPKQEAMPKEIFDGYTEGEFEGMKVCLPKDYDQYLTILFGDYMKLPPKDKQVGHHYNKGFSLTQGYEEYRKEHRM